MRFFYEEEKLGSKFIKITTGIILFNEMQEDLQIHTQSMQVFLTNKSSLLQRSFSSVRQEIDNKQRVEEIYEQKAQEKRNEEGGSGSSNMPNRKIP